uniref:Uncharacterized protein n=1 Tax=Cacopsylla melanoneura TaxID=428564 RepID=A0A8D8ZD42_9HEMI
MNTQTINSTSYNHTGSHGLRKVPVTIRSLDNNNLLSPCIQDTNIKEILVYTGKICIDMSDANVSKILCFQDQSSTSTRNTKSCYTGIMFMLHRDNENNNKNKYIETRMKLLYKFTRKLLFWN